MVRQRAAAPGYGRRGNDDGERYHAAENAKSVRMSHSLGPAIYHSGNLTPGEPNGIDCGQLNQFEPSLRWSMTANLRGRRLTERLS